MDRGIQTTDETDKRDLEIQRNDPEKACKKQAGRKQKPRRPEIVTADYLPILLNHYFPDFNQLIDNLPDPRDPNRTVYSIRHEIYLGILMFLSHAGSRSQFDSDCRMETFCDNFNLLTGEDNEYIARMDTVFYLLKQMDPERFSKLPGELVKTLITKNVLRKYRFNGEYLIAVDGTEVYRSKIRHCDKCLVQEHRNGTTDYFHTVLEAKLITRDGLALSVASVFVENESKSYDKQDCELKAFYRLEKILKEIFPQLHICLLMDSLYANENVLEICERNKWGFFLAFKPGAIPTLYQKAFDEIENNPENSVTLTNGNNEREVHRWACNQTYRSSVIHLVTVDVFSKNEKGGEDGQSTRFVYLTDTRPCHESIVELNNYGGRQRSKIEEAFNVQKNNGYNLEHNYGAQGFAYKNCYIIMQMAHLLHQLMYNSDLSGKLVSIKLRETMSTAGKAIIASLVESVRQTRKLFPSLKDFARKFGESMRYRTINGFALDPQFAGSIQIRLYFDTS